MQLSFNVTNCKFARSIFFASAAQKAEASSKTVSLYRTPQSQLETSIKVSASARRNNNSQSPGRLFCAGHEEAPTRKGSVSLLQEHEGVPVNRDVKLEKVPVSQIGQRSLLQNSGPRWRGADLTKRRGQRRPWPRCRRMQTRNNGLLIKGSDGIGVRFNFDWRQLKMYMYKNKLWNHLIPFSQ